MPAAMILLLTLASLLRVRGTGAADTVWAEDGSRFYQDSLHTGPVRLLVTPYNGYLHLVPRLAIDVARLFPIADLAAVLAIIGALISGTLAVFVAWVSRGHLPSRTLRAVVAAPVAAGWVAQAEVGNNLADAQWFLVYAAFWAAVYRGTDKAGRWASAVVLFCAAASDPFAGLYAPLLRRRRIQAVGMAAGLLYQGIGIAFMGALSSRRAHRDHDVRHAAGAYLVHVLGHVLWPGPGPWVIGAVFSGGLLVIAFRTLPRARLVLPATALAYSLLIYVALVMEGGFVAPRYAYLGTALLLAAITLAIAESGHGRVLLTAAVAVCVCWGYHPAPGPDSRAGGPSWHGQLQLAAARCRTGHGADADVAITPAPWKVQIPCPLLVRAAAPATDASPATPSAPDPAPRACPARRRSASARPRAASPRPPSRSPSPAPAGTRR